MPSNLDYYNSMMRKIGPQAQDSDNTGHVNQTGSGKGDSPADWYYDNYWYFWNQGNSGGIQPQDGTGGYRDGYIPPPSPPSPPSTSPYTDLIKPNPRLDWMNPWDRLRPIPPQPPRSTRSASNFGFYQTVVLNRLPPHIANIPDGLDGGGEINP